MEHADSSRQNNLSLIPYAYDSREVVLRHGSSIVYYDESSHSISLRNVNADVDLYECPYCHRPFKDDLDDVQQSHSDSTEALGAEASFVSPGYFRMLHYRKGGSQQSSRSPSPKRLDSSAAGETPTAPKHASNKSSDYADQHRPSSSHRISTNAFSQGYFKTFFVEQGELGRGGKGVVLLVRHLLDGVDLGLFACKRVPVGDDSEWLKRVLIEVQLLQNLSHQNLVSYRHVWLENAQITTFGPEVPCAFILQQYCNAGDLHNYIFSSVKSTTKTKEQMKNRARRRSKGQVDVPTAVFAPRRMPFDEIFSFFRDITSGLNYLHNNNYVHRDLKPSNCLLHKIGSKIRVLVSDFGEMQSANIMRSSTGNTGTISFCAPEVLRRDGTGALGNFSKKSDVFSLGMIVHLMCFGHLPYANADAIAEENEDIDLLREEIAAWTGMDELHLDRSDLPERLYKFLKQLLSLDPDERPSTDEIWQGIKAGPGFVDSWPSSRSTANSPVPEEYDFTGHMRNNMDGAAASSSASVSHHGANSAGLTRRPNGARSGSMSGVPRLRSPTESKSSPNPNRPMSPTKRPSPPLAGEDESVAMVRNPSARTPTTTVVEPQKQFTDAIPSQVMYRAPPRLLPPPARHSSRMCAILDSCLPGNRSRGAAAISVAKICLLCLKLWLCLRPCSPLAPRAVVAYPLLAIAAFDLIGPFKSPVLSVVLMAFHYTCVLLATQRNVMCEVEVVSDFGYELD